MSIEFERLPAATVLRIFSESKGFGIVAFAWKIEREAEHAIVAQLAALLPGPYYMDPPDGGDVTILEQLRRMADDARKWREQSARIDAAIDAAIECEKRCGR